MYVSVYVCVCVCAYQRDVGHMTEFLEGLARS